MNCSAVLASLGEVVALPVLALQFKQALHLPGTLNAFGNRFQVHFLRESSDQPNHAAGGAVGLHLPHQRAVDLQRIPWKLPQASQ